MAADSLQSRMRRIRRNSALGIGAGLILVVTLSIGLAVRVSNNGVASSEALVDAVAGTQVARQKKYGPARCTHCRLAYPMVDDVTTVYIETYAKKLAQPGLQGRPSHKVLEGDTIMVCNEFLCVEYVLSSTGDWEGVSAREQSTPREELPGRA